MTRIYCYKCLDCTYRFETDKFDAPYCHECGHIEYVIRDYKAESVNLTRENIRAVKEK